jgi:DNA helicase-2/ATP-dependent DNA helicase PcrA
MTRGETRASVQDEGRFHLRYASGGIEENWRDSAEDVLVSYSRDYQDDLINTYRPEIPFEILISDEENEGAALVSGEIDLLERRDPETNEVEEVDIIDFKTSEEPDDEPEKMRDNRFQVQLYGLATRVEFELEAVDGYIHYLGEDEEERIDVDLSDFKMEQVRKLVKSQVDKIMQRQFFADPEEEKCGRCDFEMICPHAATK